MEGLRTSLAQYAVTYANMKMTPTSKNGFEAFTEVGSAYVNLAFDEPELYKFLYMNGGSKYNIGNLEALTAAADNQWLISEIAQEFEISTEHATMYLTNSIIYSNGILALVVSKVLNCNKKQVKTMINNAGYAFLLQAGANIVKAKDVNNHLIGEEQ